MNYDIEPLGHRVQVSQFDIKEPAISTYGFVESVSQIREVVEALNRAVAKADEWWQKDPTNEVANATTTSVET